jgi:hypothetical protein
MSIVCLDCSYFLRYVCLAMCILWVVSWLRVVWCPLCVVCIGPIHSKIKLGSQSLWVDNIKMDLREMDGMG